MMNVTQFGRYLKNKEELIARLDIKDRDLELVPRKNLITTVIGPRRAGKTYVFYKKFILLAGGQNLLRWDWQDVGLEFRKRSPIGIGSYW